MDKKWNQFAFSSLTFQGRYSTYWMRGKWYTSILCQQWAPVVPCLTDTWKCSTVSQERAHPRHFWPSSPLSWAADDLRGEGKRIVFSGVVIQTGCPSFSFVFKIQASTGSNTNHYTAGRIIWGPRELQAGTDKPAVGGESVGSKSE